jgi:hypothetical protein
MARSFREAEEASNAQGTVQAALDWALANAKKSPTPENIAIAKDTFAARQATIAAQPSVAESVKSVVESMPVSKASLDATITESKSAIADATSAAAEAAAIGTTKTNFPKAGTLLRYKAGKATGSRIAVYADGNGGEFDGEETNNPVNPGSTGFTDTGVVTLAANTFANTIGLLMGELESSQPWVEELRTLTQGFINTGSSVDEAINLALRDAKAQGKASKFVNRFSAIFKLQDRLNAGETVQVPSIADYVKSEQALGEVFRAVNLGDLATQEVAAKILGDANKSVAEATAIISDVFGAIDNAPEALKNDLKTYFPGADRTSIAKALLLGKEGADELTKKVASISQLSAAKSQGVGIDLATGADLAAGGATYGTSLGKFATVKQLERGQDLGRMSNIDFTQQDAIGATFKSSAAAAEKIRRIDEEEANRFAARGGRLASQNRASGQI